MVDLSHFPMTYETSRFVVRILRPYITHFHSGNAVVKEGCKAYGDQHLRFGFPNSANDTEELQDFFIVLKKEGSSTPWIPTCFPWRSSPGEEDGDIILVNRAYLAEG